MNAKYINKEKIAILLSTYNGGKYLAEQLDSLFHQSNQSFHLYIRDDGSSDDTIQIIEQYRASHSEKISLIDDGKSHKQATASFLSLLEYVDSKYYMFCDQDDIWLPFKIENTFKYFLAIEKENQANTPIAVFTDLKIVDENLKVIKESFLQTLNMNAIQKHPDLLCVHNVVTGSTMILNRAVKKITFPISPYAHMHDEWIALCVHFRGGVLASIKEPTIYYRQHTTNTIGANQDHSIKMFWSPNWRKQLMKKINLLHKEFGVSYFHFFLCKILYGWLT